LVGLPTRSPSVVVTVGVVAAQGVVHRQDQGNLDGEHAAIGRTDREHASRSLGGRPRTLRAMPRGSSSSARALGRARPFRAITIAR
jgi:hypothetical protein